MLLSPLSFSPQKYWSLYNLKSSYQSLTITYPTAISDHQETHCMLLSELLWYLQLSLEILFLESKNWLSGGENLSLENYILPHSTDICFKEKAMEHTPTYFVFVFFCTQLISLISWLQPHELRFKHANILLLSPLSFSPQKYWSLYNLKSSYQSLTITYPT